MVNLFMLAKVNKNVFEDVVEIHIGTVSSRNMVGNVKLSWQPWMNRSLTKKRKDL